MSLRPAPAAPLVTALLAAALVAGPASGTRAFEPEVLDSVVSVLPLWSGHKQGGDPAAAPGEEPEGTAVAVAPGGYLATALHVVARATEITVRRADGRLRAARLVGGDAPTDLALLKIDDDLPPLKWAGTPELAEPVCAVGNQFGLGLTVTCGVVSGVAMTGVGFNPIEDFIQTDATVNPGASGGALVDAEGRLVGLLSAIFTKDSDASIGVNFAVSAALLRRIAEDLIAHGRVKRGRSGLRVADLPREARFDVVGAEIAAVAPGGGGEQAGLRAGDIVTGIGGRPIRRASDVTSATQLFRPGDSIPVTVRRDGAELAVELVLGK